MRLPVTKAKVMPTILIVDDDVVDRMTLKRVCSNVDANLAEAISGVDALEKIEQLSHLALIFLDVRMPKMNGFEVATKLRELSQTLHTPIIFITASIPFDLKLLAQEVVQLLAVNKQNNAVQLVLNYAENTPRDFIGDPTPIRKKLKSA
jgi:CheY-like chemotaxis protein